MDMKRKRELDVTKMDDDQIRNELKRQLKKLEAVSYNIALIQLEFDQRGLSYRKLYKGFKNFQ